MTPDEKFLLSKTRSHLADLFCAVLSLELIDHRASGRSYYRIREEYTENSFILAVLDLQHEAKRSENDRLITHTSFLRERGVPVAQILAQDLEGGLLWFEDLGATDLYSLRSEPWKVRQPLYATALSEVAKMHAIAEGSCSIELEPPFDASLYHWELDYFSEYFLEKFLGGATEEDLQFLAQCREDIALLTAQPRSLIHRDFQSQNILIHQGRPYLIDFQGMRWGLPAYDLASLLFDPYIDLSETQRNALLNFYNQIAPPIDPNLLALCARQRLLQALGAYANLGYVQKRPFFLQQIPQALTHLANLPSMTSAVDEMMERLRKTRGNSHREKFSREDLHRY